MATIFHYTASDGGHFAPESVKVRKLPSDPSKVKAFRFVPLASNGTDRVKVARRIISPETFSAWLAEEDAEKRTALLAGVDSIVTESNVTPTASQLAAMRALPGVTVESFGSLLRAGFLAVPSDRAERGAATSKDKAAMTEAERTDAALALLFAAAAPETEPTAEPETETETETETDDQNLTARKSRR